MIKMVLWVEMKLRLMFAKNEYQRAAALLDYWSYMTFDIAEKAGQILLYDQYDLDETRPSVINVFQESNKLFRVINDEVAKVAYAEREYKEEKYYACKQRDT